MKGWVTVHRPGRAKTKLEAAFKSESVEVSSHEKNRAEMREPPSGARRDGKPDEVA